MQRQLGADTQQIKFAELYVALQQGVVDGQENPLANIASAKLYEVQKYLSLTGHKYEVNPFLMSKRSWEKLSPEDQKIFDNTRQWFGIDFVPKMSKVLRMLPAAGTAITKASRRAMPDRVLSRGQKELIAATVSAMNVCEY